MVESLLLGEPRPPLDIGIAVVVDRQHGAHNLGLGDLLARALGEVDAP